MINVLQPRRRMSLAALAVATVATTAVTLTVAGSTAAFAAGNGRVIASPCLNLRAQANGGSSLIACIPYNTTIVIDCTAAGNSVTGPYGATSLWDHTSYNGRPGYVSDAWVYTGTARAVAGTCSAPAPAPAVGRTVGHKTWRNLGVPGNCTWAALEKWHAATGYYPYWWGDARYWASTARATGWTVVADAQPRSIVVFQPGVWGADSTHGHVAWVLSVQQRADGRWITFAEMNGTAGFNRWDTSTVKDVPGMSYILAP